VSSSVSGCRWWVGVDLFFVLSGFLVSGLLMREHDSSGKIDALRFVVRRGFKIYPLFWCLIAATAIVRPVRDEPLPAGQLFAELLFVQNYFKGLWNHTWSLAVEEHFYLGLVALFLAFGRSRARAGHFPLGRTTVALLVAGLLLRIVALAADQAALFLSHCRIDSLFVGVGCRWLWERRGRSLAMPGWSVVVASAIGFGLPGLFPIEYGSMVVFGLPLIAASFGVVTLAMLNVPAPALRWLAPFSAVGQWSYGIYLFHMPCVHWGIDFLREQGVRLSYESEFLIYVLMSILVGAVATFAIERPILRLRDHIVPAAGQPC
jgi:peptidoglycan/LPS O-acetylase OafA/YrhL